MEYNIKESRFINGLRLCGQRLPEEMLIEIFSYLKSNRLLKCRLVCKCWSEVVCDRNVWIRQVEKARKQKLPAYKNLSWFYYYLMSRNVLDQNLVKNHSGELGFEFWTIRSGVKWRKWSIENPPLDVPDLPDDPIFKGKKYCFVPGVNEMRQIIPLSSKGFTFKFLNSVQPPIQVSIWYVWRGVMDDGQSTFSLKIYLIDKYNRRIRRYMHDYIVITDQRWNRIMHIFENYGKNLSYIQIEFGGYCKVAGACVKILIPRNKLVNESDVYQ